MRYFILFKRANKLVSSFNSEGYILISEGHNREACTFNAFLRHHYNGSRIRISGNKNNLRAWKNGKIIIDESL